ncbi:hypothetical protein [Spongiactinospora sp. TRM90649]|uniref:hypothetical protein n=1 Tax=Spongiactinospora sp. TRM90649 TaxID=3031114 RepID=UPI0023F77322|nr:hypothetical protein [Spongiactinospora sp. TRM90649]MDF5753113.1 hypothetical protein [Spongiactinospora sp. TRM90649]
MSSALILDLTADIATIGRLLKQGNPPLVQAGLLRVGSRLSGLLATDLHDSGDPRTAREVWRAARRAADASGDRLLAVYSRAKEADDLWWAGSAPALVKELADEAIELAGNTPSYGLMRAHATRARLAADGHEGGGPADARAALREFRHTFERLPPAADHGQPESGLGEAWVRWHEAHLLTMIGDSGTEDAFSDALGLYPRRHPRHRLTAAPHPMPRPGPAPRCRRRTRRRGHPPADG